jgi:hypothetical protein
MFRPIVTALFLLFIISCNSQVQNNNNNSNSSDTTLTILTYGLPNMDYERARSTVAKKYGFQYYGVAGCVVSEKLIDSVKKENKRVYKILEGRFGENWKETFEKQVDTMQILQLQVEELVKKETYIVSKEKELVKAGNGLYYAIDPVDKQNIFAVKAYGWGTGNGEAELLIYYKLTVDLTKKTVTKNSDVVEKLKY